MIMCHTANSHFALLLPPGLTSQCISSIMQQHWDPFHCVPRRVPRTRRPPSMIPRQALQPERSVQQCSHRYSIYPGMLPCLPPTPRPPRLPGSQGMVVRLPHIQGSSGVIISGSPQVTLGLAEGALKAWPEKGSEEKEKKKRRGGGEEARSRREPRATPWLDEGQAWEGREGVWGGGGGGGGGGTEGGVKYCKAVSQSHVPPSHEPGWVCETSWKYLQTHSGHGFTPPPPLFWRKYQNTYKDGWNTSDAAQIKMSCSDLE